jgi:6-pyruvoyltetrahydropterin/6-carboxytetrahydropterin synthase
LFELTIKDSFSAAHFLDGYNGPCENMHGHNYTVLVSVQCEELNEIGISIDFKTVKQFLSEIFKKLDHQFLNKLPEFSSPENKKNNPSAENIAKYIYNQMEPRLKNTNIALHKVTLFETESSSVTYFKEP